MRCCHLPRGNEICSGAGSIVNAGSFHTDQWLAPPAKVGYHLTLVRASATECGTLMFHLFIYHLESTSLISFTMIHRILSITIYFTTANIHLTRSLPNNFIRLTERCRTEMKQTFEYYFLYSNRITCFVLRSNALDAPSKVIHSNCKCRRPSKLDR